jgi:hypothetical protein
MSKLGKRLIKAVNEAREMVRLNKFKIERASSTACVPRTRRSTKRSGVVRR